MSEFGADALFGNRGDAQTALDGGVSRRSSLPAPRSAVLESVPFLRGTTPWILKDFRSPRKRTASLVLRITSIERVLYPIMAEKKKAFFVLQDFYREFQSAQAP